jgi:hypothetical protein
VAPAEKAQNTAYSPPKYILHLIVDSSLPGKIKEGKYKEFVDISGIPGW